MMRATSTTFADPISGRLCSDYPRRLHVAPPSPLVRVLTNESEAEAIAFLSERPVHTVNLVSLIRDNGVESSHNRGVFYACRDERGRLEGVALIGHATLIEARTNRALEAFAHRAQGCAYAHMVMGESERIQEFWNYYSVGGQDLRLACRELLFELRWPGAARQEVNGLRLATTADLGLIMPVQAHMAEEESGVNPLERDPEGFRGRCTRRIERGRTWVLIEGGRLVFKAELFADTPEVNYLEGIYVAPDERGKGRGLCCLSQLSRSLLQRTGLICVLVNERNTQARAFYLKAGFKYQCEYDTIFLRQNEHVQGVTTLQ